MRAMKICIVIFLILCIVSFSLTVVLCFVRENEKVKRIALEAQVSQLEKDKAGLQMKVQDLNGENEELRRDVEKQKGLVDSYKTKVRDQKATIEEQEKRLAQIDADLTKLRDEYAEFKKSSSGIIEDYKDQNQGLLAQIQRLRSSPGESFTNPPLAQGVIPPPAAEGQNNVNVSVELEPVVVKPQISVSGRVEVVNRKFNFVISNIGADDGLKIGDVLNVYRDEQPIGLVRVEKLYDVLSASAIVEERENLKIQEGDIIGI
ncbi:MAG: hypothetical protein JW938_07295 [Candidatus Omnitrophica bacterium]|nr:hypothetical protein [Candidatus Omnitrophota bacterium]